MRCPSIAKRFALKMLLITNNRYFDIGGKDCFRAVLFLRAIIAAPGPLGGSDGSYESMRLVHRLVRA